MEQNFATEKGEPMEPAGLSYSGTVRSGEETLGGESHEEVLDESNNEDVSIYADPGKDWSALEGVSRVNTLLTLPRFVPGKEDIQAAGGAKSRN